MNISTTTRVVSTAAVAIAVIASAWILGGAWRSTHPHMQKISVTGLAQRDFSSDLIVWRASFSRKALSMKEAYPTLRQDVERVRAYLVDKGVPAANIVFSAVNITQEYRTEQIGNGGRTQDVFDGVRLEQHVTVESPDVDRIENVSRQISELIDAGIELNSQPPQYFFTKLAELKLDLLARASKDGRDRAEKIAEQAGGRLGSLLQADMGIFQITAQNSNEDYSWGGAFNTTSKRKTASITVRMDFFSN
ncbi:SIMPL domain-containing protein [soil metagenome]